MFQIQTVSEGERKTYLEFLKGNSKFIQMNVPLPDYPAPITHTFESYRPCLSENVAGPAG